MSSSNVMEVITKGRYLYDTSDSTVEDDSRVSTSHSTRPDSQLSLEYLSPEAPYYGSSTADGLQDQILYQSDEEDQAQTEASAELYKRIQVLTDQVHSKMDTMKELDTLSSNQSTPVPTEEQPYRNLTHELNTHSESNIFTTERRASAIKFNEGKEKSYFDLVLGLDNEDGVPSIINRDSTLTAEPEPSITSMDPKMKKAIEKMKKLDEKLVDLDKKEKEVKKQRKLLEQQADDDLHTSSTHSLDRQRYPPVFKTQLNDNVSAAGDITSRTTKPRSSTNVNQVDPETEQTDDVKTKPKTQAEISGTDFIRRNIELASDAGALVAMTEAEKQRLDELLGEEDNSKLSDTDVKLSVCVSDVDEGFALKQEDLDRMRTIDGQLQASLPPSDWESLSCSSRTDTHTPSLNTLDEDSSTETVDLPQTEVDKGRHIVPGEEVLHQFQMSRTESERLRTIDERLRAIHSENQLALPLPPELQDLLEKCGYDVDSDLNPLQETSPQDENTNS